MVLPLGHSVTQVLSYVERSRGLLHEVHCEVDPTHVAQVSSHLTHVVVSRRLVNPEGHAETHLPL
jgi:hypothetical protein